MITGKPIVVAVTGASGGRYALRLIERIEATGVRQHLIISGHGRQLLAGECGVKTIDVPGLIGQPSDRITIHDHDDVGAPLASGSFPTQGMVICPCSSNTLGAIASGLGSNLIWRAAQVTLKEARRLVLVHREMPLSAIDLENMLKLQRAGAIICPAAPGFYHQPQSIDDLIDFVVDRVLDLMGIADGGETRWTGTVTSAVPDEDSSEVQ